MGFYGGLMGFNMIYPLVNIEKAIENDHRNSGFKRFHSYVKLPEDNNIRSYNHMMSLNILKWGFILGIIIVWEVIWISNGCFFLQWQLAPFHPWQWYFRD